MRSNPIRYNDPTGHYIPLDVCEKGGNRIPQCHRQGGTDIDLSTFEPKQIHPDLYEDYFSDLATAYGVELPPGWRWAYIVREDVTYEDLTEYYGFVGSPRGILDGAYSPLTAYITDKSINELSLLELVSVLVHEARHGWQYDKNNDPDSKVKLPDPFIETQYGNAREIYMEADAYQYQLAWLTQNGVTSGTFYKLISDQAAVYSDRAYKSKLPSGLGFCEPLMSQCGQ